MTEIATIDWFGRWGTSVFSKNTATFSFKMVLISTNCCIIEQQTTASNTLITVPVHFLQSGHPAFAK